MYFIIKIDIEGWEITSLGGEDNNLSEEEIELISTDMVDFLKSRYLAGDNKGGFIFNIGERGYRSVFTIKRNVCEVVLISREVSFENTNEELEDELTGLETKVSFIRNVDNLMQDDDRFQLVIFNIDNFSNISDVFGVSESSKLIKDMVDRVLMGLVSNYTFYRIDGDTFGFLREGRNEERFLEDLYKLFDESFRVGGKDVYLTISTGYVDVEEFYFQNAERVLDQAYIALNHAKNSGKNIWIEYNDKLKDQSIRDLEMETMIREALREDQFHVNYQPQFSFDVDLGMRGSEALIRWVHPDEGFISPGEFIPIAEKSGLVIQIGEWVVREVCRQQREWLNEGVPIKRVDVNIGALHFRKPSFVEDIKECLSMFNLDAKYLGLEITEGSVIEDAEDMVVKLGLLKETGVVVSIDDFGTGYSSLSYLKKFPVDTLKIDQSFVMGLPLDSQNVGIVKAIISLAKHMDLKVIAEGVETEAARDVLRQLDCFDMQGYLFSKPVSAEVYREHLIKEG